MLRVPEAGRLAGAGAEEEATGEEVGSGVRGSETGVTGVAGSVLSEPM